MKVLGLIFLFIIIAVFDLPAILKKTADKVKYLIVYGVIYLISFTVSLLLVIEKVPASPSKLIQTIVKGIIGGM